MNIIIREDRDGKSHYENEFELEVAPQVGDRLLVKMIDADKPVVEFEVKTTATPPKELRKFSFVVTLIKIPPLNKDYIPYAMRIVLVKKYTP